LSANWYFPGEVHDVHTELAFAPLAEKLQARAGPVTLQQLQTQLLKIAFVLGNRESLKNGHGAPIIDTL
jgi:hypothetical protein